MLNRDFRVSEYLMIPRLFIKVVNYNSLQTAIKVHCCDPCGTQLYNYNEKGLITEKPEC